MRRSTRALLHTAATALLLVFLVFLPARGWAQGEVPDGREVGEEIFGEVIDVELVNVDVWVTDEDGLPVRGLAADDFRVVHDGDEVEITHFVEQDAAESREALMPLDAGGEGEGETLGAGFRAPAVVVYFDQLRTHPIHVTTVVEHLESLLESDQLEPEQVLVLRQDQNLHIEASFGSSRRQVGKALDRLEETVAGAELESQTTQALRQIEDLWRNAEQRQGSAATGASGIPAGAGGLSGGGSVLDRFRGSGGRGSLDNNVCSDFMSQVEPLVREWAQIEARRTRTTLWHLSRVGSYLAGLPGVKSLLYVSDGLDLQPGGHLVAYVDGLCPGGAGDLVGDLNAESMQGDFLQLTHDLNARRVTLHAVQAGGLEGAELDQASHGGLAGRPVSRRGRSAFETRLRAGEREGLTALAAETGGRVLVRRNDLAPAIRDLAADLRPHYSLAYPLPETSEGERQRGKIVVRLPESDHDLRFRRGWARINPDRLLADRLDGALFLGLVENPLGVRLSAAEAQPAAKRRVTLPLRILVPVARLVPMQPATGDAPAIAAVKLRVVARHLETQELVATETSFRIRLPESATDELSVLPVDLDLPLGSFTIGVGIRDEHSREVSVVTTQLDLGPG